MSSLPSQIAAEANDFDPNDYVDRKASRRLDRYAQLAVSAAQVASQDAHLSVDKEAENCVGVFEGTSLGPLKATLDQHEQYLSEGCRRVNPSTLLTSMMGAGSSSIALHLQTHGPSLTISDGSASSTYAIGYGYRQIKDGYIDVALVGGAEAPISQEVFATFCCARLLSTCNDDPHRAMKPFDRDRNGFVLGEGAAFLVIEDLSHALKRNAAIYAELAGFGETTDAYHPTSPHPEGMWVARAMEMALREAGLKSEDVDYLNAHGTATRANDVAETLAIKHLFGTHANNLAISSTKPVTGHLLGACGGLEAAITVLAMNQQFIPPTLNLTVPDDACNLDYVPNVGKGKHIRVAMTNNYSFGGRNASLVFREFNSQNQSCPR
jgi:3-oxoacyl-[acyl-carrier-protein] synthase II